MRQPAHGRQPPTQQVLLDLGREIAIAKRNTWPDPELLRRKPALAA